MKGQFDSIINRGFNVKLSSPLWGKTPNLQESTGILLLVLPIFFGQILVLPVTNRSPPPNLGRFLSPNHLIKVLPVNDWESITWTMTRATRGVLNMLFDERSYSNSTSGFRFVKNSCEINLFPNKPMPCC